MLKYVKKKHSIIRIFKLFSNDVKKDYIIESKSIFKIKIRGNAPSVHFFVFNSHIFRPRAGKICRGSKVDRGVGMAA